MTTPFLLPTSCCVSAVNCGMPCTEVSILHGLSHFILKYNQVMLSSWCTVRRWKKAEEHVQRHRWGPVSFWTSVIQWTMMGKFYTTCVEVAPALRPFILSSPYEGSCLFSFSSISCVDQSTLTLTWTPPKSMQTYLEYSPLLSPDMRVIHPQFYNPKKFILITWLLFCFSVLVISPL